jgi:hypothetical protein
MGAWPGGNCPECGDQMPARVIRCATCRALLNSDLAIKPIIPPEFVPLPEISATTDVPLKGVYVSCPACTRELRVGSQFIGQRVQCRFCDHEFDLNRDVMPVEAGYAQCPHCTQELRAAKRFFGVKVSCRFCQGSIRLIDPAAKPIA